MKRFITLFNLIFLMSMFNESISDKECLTSSICGTDIKCSKNGRCEYNLTEYYKKNNSTSKYTQYCTCIDGYTTRNKDSGLESPQCCYPQSSQTIAFLLEFFLGFGLGHFYIGNSILGFIKLSCYSFFCCSCCSIACCFCCREVDIQKNNYSQQFMNILLIFSVSGCFLWQFIDIILFGMNFYKDSNKVDLQRW